MQKSITLDEVERNGVGDDLVLGPYKLPLRKLSKGEGHGFYGALSLTADNKYIQCHVCGVLRRNLSMHLRGHKMTVKEYRTKFGIAGTTALVSEEFRKESIQRMLDLRAKMEKEGSMEKLMRICNDAKLESLKKNGHPFKGRTHLAAEDLNKRGICPDQLLQLIHDAVKHYGYTPSYAEFEAFHGTSRFISPIKRTFGSWKNAVEKAGYTPKVRGYSVEGGRIQYTDEELIEILGDFYRDNKRLPTPSDFKRGFLPTWGVYTRRFGSMAAARERAGIDITVTRGGAHTPEGVVKV